MLLHEGANMEQSVPENLSTHVFNECKMKLLPSSHDPVDSSENGSSTNSNSDPPTKDSQMNQSLNPNSNPNSTTPSSTNSTATTKVKLSFSVDRLLGEERNDPSPSQSLSRQCCDSGIYSCCTFPSCFPQTSEAATNKQPSVSALQAYQAYPGLDKFYPGLYMDYKSILRPTPIRAAEHGKKLELIVIKFKGRGSSSLGSKYL